MRNIIIIAFLLSILTGCSPAICGADSKEVTYAKALTSLQLKKLFKDTTEFFQNNERIRFIGEIPAQFKDIGIKAISVHKGIHLRLQSCFDHYIDLVVFDQGEKQRIELWYGGNGEKLQKDMLWKK